MVKLESNELLKFLPNLFKINLNKDKDGGNIFKKLENVFDFDTAYIFYLNPDSVQLKYSYTNQELADSVYPMTKSCLELLYSAESFMSDNNSALIKSLGFVGDKSYLLSKLSVGETVYGFILLGNKKENAYTSSDLSSLDACAAIISYVIKDLELSNVFKIQLKALKDGLIEKNRAYKIIKEQNEKILEADKVKTEFLANVSHELRTPLNAILGFSEILSDGKFGGLNPKQQEYIDDIRASGTHLLGMINEILDISKIEAKAVKLVKTQFTIRNAVVEVANILKPLAAKKKIHIIIDCENDFEVVADYQKLQQILYNLVNNAIKFSPENDEVVISLKRKKNSFTMSVHDNGIGIDEKYQGKIFAKFVQLDSAYTKKESSTGLGLTITKDLTEMHGGKVSVKSEVNNGSTFIVEIPQDS